MTPGKFITFEGIDGCGKSTAAKAAFEYLEKQGIEAIRTRQPGGTTLGEELRQILLHSKAEITPINEVLFFAASFQASLHETILPALKRGVWVLSDRWIHSTLAYQCGGRGVPYKEVKQILQIAAPKKPDLKILFEVSPEIAMQRLNIRPTKDRMEAEGLRFLEKVHREYQRTAQTEKMHRISTENLDMEETAQATINAVARLLPKKTAEN